MTNGEKTVTWGLMALIAWELWNLSNPAPPKVCDNVSITGAIPDFVTQLSQDLTAV